jgi:photosystem II stability/assembly factor-like uncharacterized protein
VFRSTDGGEHWSPVNSGLHVSLTAGLVNAQGQYELFTQAGHALVSQADGTRLQLMPQQDPSPVAGAILAADGSRVVVGSRGARALSVK